MWKFVLAFLLTVGLAFGSVTPESEWDLADCSYNFWCYNGGGSACYRLYDDNSWSSQYISWPGTIEYREIYTENSAWGAIAVATIDLDNWMNANQCGLSPCIDLYYFTDYDIGCDQCTQGDTYLHTGVVFNQNELDLMEIDHVEDDPTEASLILWAYQRMAVDEQDTLPSANNIVPPYDENGTMRWFIQYGN